MGRAVIFLVLLCLAALAAAPAHALCRDDLQRIEPQIQRMKLTDPQRFAAASKWFAKAEAIANDSELYCHNYYQRARKALAGQLDEANNCTGTDAYLPQCQFNGAARDGGAVEALQPYAPTAGNAGGVGGAAPFTPPPAGGKGGTQGASHSPH